MWAIRKNSGFTIVELLIVIVVIGILAAIVIVAFNGINTRAQQASIAGELRQWSKLFELYKAQYGSYPLPAASPTTDGGPGTNVGSFYCLGTGFPTVSGTRYCYAYNNGPYQVEESRGSTLITELTKVGNTPNNSAKYTYGNLVGPYLRWISTSDIRLASIFSAGAPCADMGFTVGTTWTTAQECYIRLSN